MSYRDRDQSPGRDFGRHLAAVPDKLTPADELEVIDPDDWSLAARELFDHEQQRVWAELDAEHTAHHAPPEHDATVVALDAVRRARTALDTRTDARTAAEGQGDEPEHADPADDEQADTGQADRDDAADGED